MTQPEAQQPKSCARPGVRPRLAWWWLAALALLGLLALGFQREARSRRAPIIRSTPRFHFGKKAPAFSLVNARGGQTASDSLKGKWSVLVFCSSACPFTRKALKSLAPLQKRWPDRLNIVCIVPESRRTARRLLHSCNFPVLLDPDRRVHRSYLDRAFQVPSFVLLDPDGRMRFQQQGYQVDCKGKSAFATLLSDFLDSNSDVFVPLEPCADGTVAIGESKRKLSQLWADGTLVLVFVAPGQPASMSVMAGALRFRHGPESMKFLFLSPAGSGQGLKQPRAAGQRFLSGRDESGQLLYAYDVRSFPRIFMIRDGFLIGRRGQPCKSCGVAWERVPEAALFTCTPRPGSSGGRT